MTEQSLQYLAIVYNQRTLANQYCDFLTASTKKFYKSIHVVTIVLDVLLNALHFSWIAISAYFL